MKKPVFTGAAVAIITPMNADGSVNFEELGRIIDDQMPMAPMPSSSAVPPESPRRCPMRSIPPASAMRSSRPQAVCR